MWPTWPPNTKETPRGTLWHTLDGLKHQGMEGVQQKQHQQQQKQLVGSRLIVKAKVLLVEVEVVEVRGAWRWRI